nr:retrovirus-related Pol polyprotein from transposon TNT 1-94 [Tanacetum cinerariifolium]GFA81416.1 retrovirus-related Pol polyprotein from transposon TNT 1-94 [Tanacetum cinerariifolium]
TETECLVLSPNFKLPDEKQVLLKVPRQNNMYSFNLKNVVPSGDHPGKFDRKADKGFFIGYSTNSKALRVFNSRTRIVEENLHIKFSENTPNIAESGPNWLFDIDALTKSINYKPIVAWNQSNGSAGDEEKKNTEGSGNEESEALITEEPRVNQEKDSVNSTNRVNAASIELPNDPNMPDLEHISIFEDSNEDVFGAEADLNNIETTFQVIPIPITRIHKDHPVEQIIRDIHLTPQTRRMTKSVTNHDYDEVFALVARIEAIRLFLAYASFKDFDVYQMDVKSTILYGKIGEEVYVCQSPGFEYPEFPDRVYKVEKALYGPHQAFRAWSTKKEMYTEFEKMMHKKFQMSSMGELTFFLGLQVTQKDDGIFISHEKYVDEILRKFGFSTVKIASTPMETLKPLLKDENAKDVDVHLYRSMIGSLMYLTFLRPDIMFAICTCARF